MLELDFGKKQELGLKLLVDDMWFTENFWLFLLWKMDISEAIRVLSEQEKCLGFDVCVEERRSQIKKHFIDQIKRASCFEQTWKILDQVILFSSFTDKKISFETHEFYSEVLFKMARQTESFSCVYGDLNLMLCDFESSDCPEKISLCEHLLRNFKRKIIEKVDGLTFDRTSLLKCDSTWIYVRYLKISSENQRLKNLVRSCWNELYPPVSAVKDSTAADLIATL